jgi:hypothetical protein
MFAKKIISILPLIGLLAVAATLTGGCSQSGPIASPLTTAGQTQSQPVTPVSAKYWQNVHWGDAFTPN